jgi:hypothetical protein
LDRVGCALASLFVVSGWVGFWGFGSGRPVPPCLTCRVGFFSGWVGFLGFGSGRVGSARASVFDVSGWVLGLWVGSTRASLFGVLVGSARASMFDVLGRVFLGWVGFLGFGLGRVSPCLPV